MRTAVYPGSFDPITNGHISIIKRALAIFDKVIVAVIHNPSKQPQFSAEERVAMISESLLGIKNIEVKSFDGLLIDFVKSVNGQAVIRGLRAVSDFDYEFQMALMNRRMSREIETIFLMTSYKYSYLSSSIIKEAAKLGGDISGLVPAPVEAKLKQWGGK
jgi:pantetheine-phosphate adenylyltransferase